MIYSFSSSAARLAMRDSVLESGNPADSTLDNAAASTKDAADNPLLCATGFTNSRTRFSVRSSEAAKWAKNKSTLASIATFSRSYRFIDCGVTFRRRPSSAWLIRNVSLTSVIIAPTDLSTFFFISLLDCPTLLFEHI